jgi:thymidylate synthase (FAD)
MKIIDQSYEILSIPKNPLYLIEKSGRVCYKSENKIGCTESHDDSGICSDALIDSGKCINTNCNAHSSHKLVRMLRDKGHHAMIEFGDITVKFITNRGVSHELVRHRVGVSHSQESTRYVKYDGNMEFIRPVWCSERLLGSWNCVQDIESANEAGDITYTERVVLKDMLHSELSYKELLNHAWRAEQAREVLPNSLKTEIVAKANYREWRHILKLRTSKQAHPQMRGLVLPLLDELKTKIPVIFGDI